MNRRQGASLTELMVVMAVISAIMAMTGMLFHRLFRSEQISTRAAIVELTTSRLADQFRRDAHAARSAQRSLSTEGDLPVLELKSDTGLPQSVVYTGGPNKVSREVVGAEGIVSRETYRLPNCRTTFPVPGGVAPQGAAEGAAPAAPSSSSIITLLIERPRSTITATTQAVPDLHGFSIDAELGRDHRLTMHTARTIPVEASEEPKE